MGQNFNFFLKFFQNEGFRPRFRIFGWRLSDKKRFSDIFQTTQNLGVGEQMSPPCLIPHVHAATALYNIVVVGPRGMLGTPCADGSVCYDQFSVCSPGGVCVCQQGFFSKYSLCCKSLHRRSVSSPWFREILLLHFLLQFCKQIFLISCRPGPQNALCCAERRRLTY